MTGLVFGLAPAWRRGRHLLNPLREGAGCGDRLQRRVHSALIVVQIALALLLLAGASIFVRTYAALRSVELGYDTSHLMTMRVYFAGADYDSPEARARAVDQIAQGLATLPGAEAATVTDLVPLDDQGGSDGPVAVEGRSSRRARSRRCTMPASQGMAGDVRPASSPGRTFYEPSCRALAPVALVNQKLAETFWPGQNPIGRRFRLAEEPRSRGSRSLASCPTSAR